MAAKMVADLQDDEYLEYAECRRTSLTAKKLPKFRDLCDFQQHLSMKLVSDMLEIFGIYAVELVKVLTELALTLKNDLNSYSHQQVVNSSALQEDEVITSLKAQSLFAIEEDEHPLKPIHIEEAYRRLRKSILRKSGMRKANVLGATFHQPHLF